MMQSMKISTTVHIRLEEWITLEGSEINAFELKSFINSQLHALMRNGETILKWTQEKVGKEFFISCYMKPDNTWMHLRKAMPVFQRINWLFMSEVFTINNDV